MAVHGHARAGEPRERPTWSLVARGWLRSNTSDEQSKVASSKPGARWCMAFWKVNGDRYRQ